jgi:hypothetical protein
MSYQQFGPVDREERIDYSPEEPPEALPPHRRIPPVALAAAAGMLFVGSLWFAYHEGATHAATGGAAGEVPLIKADPQPVKVKPDQPGGMKIPDQNDPIYARTAATPPVERLQPPPEKPAPRPAPPPPQASAPPPAASPPPSHAAAAPRALPAPPPLTHATAAKPPPAARAAVPTRVALGSLRTPDEARREWQRLKRQHANLLGKLTAVAVRSEVPHKGVWYRVEAGPLPSHDAAERLCRALRQHKIGCSLDR